MIELIEKSWYLMFGVVIGLLFIIIFWKLIRLDSTGQRGPLGFLVLGPLNNYMSRRGGLTRRESIGWAIVVLIIILVFIFNFVG